MELTVSGVTCLPVCGTEPGSAWLSASYQYGHKQYYRHTLRRGISGYAGKRADIALMRIADIISAIPSMLYVILITLVMGAGVGSMILGLCVAGWISMARIVRGEIIKT